MMKTVATSKLKPFVFIKPTLLEQVLAESPSPAMPKFLPHAIAAARGIRGSCAGEGTGRCERNYAIKGYATHSDDWAQEVI
jgi:hypothetical protein